MSIGPGHMDDVVDELVREPVGHLATVAEAACEWEPFRRVYNAAFTGAELPPLTDDESLKLDALGFLAPNEEGDLAPATRVYEKVVTGRLIRDMRAAIEAAERARPSRGRGPRT